MLIPVRNVIGKPQIEMVLKMSPAALISIVLGVLMMRNGDKSLFPSIYMGANGPKWEAAVKGQCCIVPTPNCKFSLSDLTETSK